MYLYVRQLVIGIFQIIGYTKFFMYTQPVHIAPSDHFPFHSNLISISNILLGDQKRNTPLKQINTHSGRISPSLKDKELAVSLIGNMKVVLLLIYKYEANLTFSFVQSRMVEGINEHIEFQYFSWGFISNSNRSPM